MSLFSVSSLVLCLVASTMIGFSLSLALGFDSADLSWCYRHRISLSTPAVLFMLYGLYVSGCNGLSLCMVTVVSVLFLYSVWLSSTLDVMAIIVCHYLCSLLLCLLSMVSTSLVHLAGGLLLLDILSVLVVCLIPGTSDRVGAWSYLLYQAFLTLMCWCFLSLGSYSVLSFCWFLKLGSGFSGFYLPGLYRCLSYSTGILGYIGTVNIFQAWCSYLLLCDLCGARGLGVVGTSCDGSLLGLFMVLFMAFVVAYWTYSVEWLSAIGLYALCTSSMLTIGSVFVILLCGSTGLLGHSLLGAFLFMSQCSWVLVCCCSTVL